VTFGYIGFNLKLSALNKTKSVLQSNDVYPDDCFVFLEFPKIAGAPCYNSGSVFKLVWSSGLD
jgi:hypothetical protein